MKYDIIQVPQYQDNKLYTYNYWVYEIDHITTSDTPFVRMVYKKEPKLLYLFGYVKNDKIRYYEYDVVRDENKYETNERDKRLHKEGRKNTQKIGKNSNSKTKPKNRLSNQKPRFIEFQMGFKNFKFHYLFPEHTTF